MATKKTTTKTAASKTKKAASKKPAAKKAASKKATPAPEEKKRKGRKVIEVNPERVEKAVNLLEEEGLEPGEGGGKIEAILLLHSKGFSKKEIVEAGFNKSTVYRQVNELEKLQQKPVLEYFGHTAYAGKIARQVKGHKVSVKEAVELLTGKAPEEPTEQK